MLKNHPPPQLRTVGRMAAELGEPIHRITHILATRRHIRPSARAGVLRLYDAGAVELVKEELLTMRLYRREVPFGD